MTKHAYIPRYLYELCRPLGREGRGSASGGAGKMPAVEADLALWCPAAGQQVYQQTLNLARYPQFIFLFLTRTFSSDRQLEAGSQR